MSRRGGCQTSDVEMFRSYKMENGVFNKGG